jgi:hypothetical protein
LIVKYVNAIDHTYSSKPSKRHPIWIDEMTTDFALSGTTAQSAAKRDFYPRNFNQPSYGFHGQTFSETHYGQLGEWIRKAQLDCVFRYGLMQIFLPASGATHVWVGPDGREHKREITRNQRGRRPAIWLEGYIANIQRAHEVGVQAPEYDFGFIVSRSIAGPITEAPVSPNVLPRNWDSFIKRDATGFITNPDDVLLSQGKGKKRTPPTRVPLQPQTGSPVTSGNWDEAIDDMEIGGGEF